MRADNLSRREVLQGSAAASLLLAFGLPTRAGAREASPELSPDVWVRLDTDGSLMITAHRSEMGQGSRSSLPMIVADEMGADWSRVTLEQAVGDEKYGSQNTDGSRSVRDFYDEMRKVGATARLMLIRAAAKKWRVPASQLTAVNHEVVHAKTGRTLGFGQLVPLAAGQKVPRVRASDLRPKTELRHVGDAFATKSLVSMTDGSAVFGQDVRLPGMKIAVVARCPVYGGGPVRWNKEAALAIPGVDQVLQIPTAELPAGMNALGGIAVVARNTWAALRGRAALDIHWDHGPNMGYDSDEQRQRLEDAARNPQKVVRETGDAMAKLARAERKHTAGYYVPHLAHAPMEPPSATARPTQEGGLEVWASTQNPQAAREEIVKQLGIPKPLVTVRVTFLGGGFGRKSKHDFVIEAAWLAHRLGVPVKVMWTREDDIRHGYYHAVSAQHAEATLDDEGLPAAWLQRSVFTPINSTFSAEAKYGSPGELGLGFTDMPYEVPNLLLENGPTDSHVRIGWYRSVANIYHAFAVSSFVDELAHAAGRDPADYIETLLGDRKLVPADSGADYGNYGSSLDEHPIDTGRMVAVLNKAAAMAGFAGRPKTKGRGMGIAVHRSFLAYVAAVVEVIMDDDGRLHVPRVFMAADAGTVVNTDRVISQMEGAAVMGLGNALVSKITAKQGRVQQQNFIDYRVLRMVHAPEVTVAIIPSDAPPAGVGEPGVPPIAPALCNAIFEATGKRHRSLPLSDHGVQLALRTSRPATSTR